MQNVLLPFDGSEPARRAVQYLVAASGGIANLVVHVLNVQPKPVLHGEYFAPNMLDTLDQDERRHAADINGEALAAFQAAAIRCVGHETVGDTVREIARTASELGCDTVVMGTRGMGNLANLVLGSVATRVVHEVSVPVLLVK